MGERILCVDDEPHVLRGYRRTLRKSFDLHIAEGPAEGLEALERHGPFAVVVSDFRMPGMNGVEFLTRAAHHSPDSLRIILTGFADTEIAIDAINEGEIFRFLTKPCTPEQFERAVLDGVRQYNLVRAERELLDQTLRGSVEVLTETLSLTYPAAFSRSTRVKRLVEHAAQSLGLADTWRFSVAAMLSQIGCVTLPPDLVDKVYACATLTDEEAQLFARHPETAARLIRKVPRLEVVADMVRAHPDAPAFAGEAAQVAAEAPVRVGAQLLRTAAELDRLVQSGLPMPRALAQLSRRREDYTPAIVACLSELEVSAAESVRREVAVRALQEGMVLEEDLRASNGLLLIARGQAVTYPVLERLHRVGERMEIQESVRVRMGPEQGAGEPGA